MIIFLHVPHTGGRCIGKYLWNNNLKYLKLHNADDIKNNKNIEGVKYFVLRDPVERSYREYIHYSRNLERIGQVNHLTLSNFKNLDYKNPYDYLSLEVNRNVYCKFLLLREDFNIPITEKDYSNINVNDYKFDMFSDLPYLPTLSDLISSNVNLDNKYKSNIIFCEDIKNFIIKNNEYDIRLFKSLSL